MDINKFEYIDDIPYYNGNKLNVTTNSQGYCYVYIKGKNRRLHRLIAQRYIKNPDNLKVVGHRDDIKSNNSISNLYWTTCRENTTKAQKKNPRIKINNQVRRRVLAVKGNITIEFSSITKAANVLKRDRSSVTRCCQGEWSKCNGFELSYIC